MKLGVGRFFVARCFILGVGGDDGIAAFDKLRAIAEAAACDPASIGIADRPSVATRHSNPLRGV